MVEDTPVVAVDELKSRVEALENRVNTLEKQLQANHEEDVICDWISRFYTDVLMKRLENHDVKFESWEELSAKLSAEYNGKSAMPPSAPNSLKSLCCKATGLDESDWDNCYFIKKARNNRCHPRKTWSDTWSIVNRIESESLRRSLERVMLSMRMAPFDA